MPARPSAGRVGHDAAEQDRPLAPEASPASGRENPAAGPALLNIPVGPTDGELTIGAVMRGHAVHRPAATAWVDEAGEAVSFDAFNQRVNRLNQAARAMGLAAGDRVAVLSRNRRETMEALGLGKSGMILVPLNWRLTAEELLALLQHCQPRLLFVDAEDQPRIEAIRKRLPDGLVCVGWDAAPAGWLAYEDWLATADAEEPRESAKPDDLACLLYTSGTTGTPKAVALSHRFVVGNARQAAVAVAGLTPDDRVLAALPFFHVGGLFYHGFASFWAGSTTHVLGRFEATAVIDALSQRAITYVHLVPTMVAALLDHPAMPDAVLSHLRMLFYAASPMPVELLRRAMARLPECAFIQSYGSTESGIATVLEPEVHRQAAAGDRPGRLAACGRAMPEVEVRIVGEDGTACSQGAVGEIEVRGPYSMQGYWHAADPAAAASVWRNDEPWPLAPISIAPPGGVPSQQVRTSLDPVLDDGASAAARGRWLRTGDLGYQDQDGLFYLLDRKNDMIVTGGENVYPSEVEACLHGWPELREACVFGQPHPHWVEQVAVAVVLRPGHLLSPEEIQQRLRQQLAAYKCPRRVYFLDELPKNATGKVARRVLQQSLPPQA
ncbi:MAG: AMP-binding protein [Pigmentiphaga sp.]